MTRTLNHLNVAGTDVTRDNPGEVGFGVLRTDCGTLPLVKMDVATRIIGLFARTTITQKFHNGLDEPLEATYIFPLPDRAAVTAFVMKAGDREIVADLMERRQAREEYDAAIKSGRGGSILEEERSGTFTIRVGNIPAQQAVSVTITLVGPLPVENGEVTYRFPLVVAPRYISGLPREGASVGMGWGPDTNEVPDGSRVTPPVLLPGFPNPVRLSLVVELDPAGLYAPCEPHDGLSSGLHHVIITPGDPCTVRLQPQERLDRDFILRFPLQAASPHAAVLVSPGRDGKPGTFAVIVVPPTTTALPPQAPRDVVVLLDHSGSMAGWKIVAARRAVGHIVDSLRDQDRFAVVAFDDRLEYPDRLEAQLASATNRNRSQVIEWLARVDARGGTEVGQALQAALAHLAGADGSRQRTVVLVTDGQVGGEDAVLRLVQGDGRHAVPRIHTIGIDTAVNGGFLRRLADKTGGLCELVESEDRLQTAMRTIHRCIATPAVTGLSLEFEGIRHEAESLAPSRLPDVFADRPAMVFGRFCGDPTTLRVTVRGADALGAPWCDEARTCTAAGEELLSLWGRAKVRELEDIYAAGETRNQEALASRIVAVSLESHVLSRFTAYVAVDRAEVVNKGGKVHHILQPVELPARWSGVSYCMSLQAMAVSSSYDAREFLDHSLRHELDQCCTMPTPDSGAEPTASLPFALEALKRLLRLRRSMSAMELARLVEVLERFAAGLQQAGHPAAVLVETLAVRGRSLLNSAADPSQIDQDQLRAFTEAVKLIVAKVDWRADRERAGAWWL